MRRRCVSARSISSAARWRCRSCCVFQPCVTTTARKMLRRGWPARPWYRASLKLRRCCLSMQSRATPGRSMPSVWCRTNSCRSITRLETTCNGSTGAHRTRRRRRPRYPRSTRCNARSTRTPRPRGVPSRRRRRMRRRPAVQRRKRRKGSRRRKRRKRRKWRRVPRSPDRTCSRIRVTRASRCVRCSRS